MGYFFVALGIAVIVAGLFGKNFTEADVLSLSQGKRSIPRWAGRLLLVTVGTSLVVAGIMFLVRGGI